MATMLGKSQDNPNEIAQKKALVMTLGNAKDLNALLDILYTEENEEIRCHVITILAALGKVEAIEDLKKIYNNESRKIVKDRIEEAIKVIQGMSVYLF